MFYLLTNIKDTLPATVRKYNTIAESLQDIRSMMLFDDTDAITWTAYTTHTEGNATWSYPVATFTACRGQIIHSTVPDILLAMDAFSALERIEDGMRRFSGEEFVALATARIAFEVLDPSGRPVAGAVFGINLDNMPLCAAIDFFQTRQRGIFEKQIRDAIEKQFPGHSFRLISVQEARARKIYEQEGLSLVRCMTPNKN
jgi:hypothetical protein